MDAASTAVDDVVETMDPRDACARALGDGLLMQREDPLNCETPVAALTAGVAMPTAHFYVRNHFPIPRLDPLAWRLSVVGLVKCRLSLSLRDLHHLPAQSLVATLECAGNGRALLQPAVEGEQWSLGAVSTAEWTGVPLREILERAGTSGEAYEVVFRGADRGTVGAGMNDTRFERSLSLRDARESQALLVYAMNGQPLPSRHG